MKKLLTLSLLLMTAIIFVPSAQAKSATLNSLTANNAEPQIRIQVGPQRRGRQVRRNQRVRVVNRTRIVRVGRQRYRETIQIRYLPNGRTQTRVISRVRLGRY